MEHDHDRIAAMLNEIWRKGIKADFEAGRIVTERELQCCLYYHLRAALGDDKMRVLIEPSIRGADKRIPDILIVTRDPLDPSACRISLFLELKVARYPEFVDELKRIAERGPGTSFDVTRQRLDGRRTTTKLICDESTQFALAFLAAVDAKAVYAKDMLANDGGAFATQHAGLAARTTLLYGRIHAAGTNDFGAEPLLAAADPS